ncbi:MULTISPECIES: hypothetical protein [unclassified Psychrobacter]|uniref:hypothetical protein n=1 Tax=unclassified Psychrobacter TaxID=196806 RepID=UPI003F48C082
MVSQASAAPEVTKHHMAQVKHQTPRVKVDNKHQQVKKKAVVSKHQSKKAAAHLKAKSKYQAKQTHSHSHRS